MSILKLSNVNTGYGKKQVLHDVSLDIQPGETLLIVGSNGSGKSTLLKVIYGLLDIWSGTIEYDGSLLHNENHKTPTHTLLNKGIMYIPQKNALFEDMTVEENIYTSLLYLNNNKVIKDRINNVWEVFPNLYKRKKQLAGQLSGGERKMLSLAMVVANRPKLLLYDEPLAGLSEDKVPIVLNKLRLIHQEGVAMIIVEHRIKELMQFNCSIFGLKYGYLYTNNFSSLDNVKNFML